MAAAGFGFYRWLLAPRTTWRARRLRVAYPWLSGDQAWSIARLYRYPEEFLYAQNHLRRQEPGSHD
jgi:hypothetical protein